MHTWIWTILFAALLTALAFLRKSSQVSGDVAQQMLNSNAVLVDVRTPGEFGSGHLSKAINIPVDRIAAELPRRIAEKDRPILLYCQSGMRSATALRQLRGLGYTRAFNLGSYGRAAQIVKDARKS